MPNSPRGDKRRNDWRPGDERTATQRHHKLTTRHSAQVQLGNHRSERAEAGEWRTL